MMEKKPLPDRILACWRCRSVKLRPDGGGVDYICAACGGLTCIEDIQAAWRGGPPSRPLTAETWEEFLTGQDLEEDGQVLLGCSSGPRSFEWGYRTLPELRAHIEEGRRVLWLPRTEPRDAAEEQRKTGKD